MHFSRRGRNTCLIGPCLVFSENCCVGVRDAAPWVLVGFMIRFETASGPHPDAISAAESIFATYFCFTTGSTNAPSQTLLCGPLISKIGLNGALYLKKETKHFSRTCLIPSGHCLSFLPLAQTLQGCPALLPLPLFVFSLLPAWGHLPSYSYSGFLEPFKQPTWLNFSWFIWEFAVSAFFLEPSIPVCPVMHTSRSFHSSVTTLLCWFLFLLAPRFKYFPRKGLFSICSLFPPPEISSIPQVYDSTFVQMTTKASFQTQILNFKYVSKFLLSSPTSMACSLTTDGVFSESSFSCCSSRPTKCLFWVSANSSVTWTWNLGFYSLPFLALFIHPVTKTLHLTFAT